MGFFADIGGWQMLKVFLATLPEMTAWVAVLSMLGLFSGTLLLMASLRWLFPWSRLYLLRQARYGWIWFCYQWTWVLIWGVTLPACGLAVGGLMGTAYGTRALILREHVGQVVGERILGPIAVQVAAQLQPLYPAWGDLVHAPLKLSQVKQLLEGLSPQLVEAALARVPMLDESNPDCSGMELAGRRFARKAIHHAAAGYFAQKTRFVEQILLEFEHRSQQEVTLKDLVACASHLYFTPAFASWTYWWIVSHTSLILPIWLACWVTPGLLFGFLLLLLRSFGRSGKEHLPHGSKSDDQAHQGQENVGNVAQS